MGRILKAEDVQGAIELYRSLPAATFFKGLTGHGLISEDGVEKVGEITSSAGIWKPMYFFITGGEKTGRKTLTAENVKKAVKAFEENELFALLRVTTGRGIRVTGGMSQLIDIIEATAGINFELTHFGGRSIVPRMEVELSKLQDANINWQSGFLYQSQGSYAPAMNRNLILTRVLAEEEFASQERFERVWQDIDKEVKRLMFMHCDSESLPVTRDNGYDRVRTFFSQELTALVLNIEIEDKKYGFEYSVRRDGTVVVQKSIRPFEYQDIEKFAMFMGEFTTECYRVYTLYCNPLTDSQKGKLGKSVDENYGLIQTGEGQFGCDSRRSRGGVESLIMWIERRGAPNFPYEGWNPEKEKEFFVFRHRWGRGYRVSPGNPRYQMRCADNGDGTYSQVEFRTEFDGTEKEVAGSRSAAVQFKTRNEYCDGWWSTKELVITGQNEGYLLQGKTDHRYHYIGTVSDDGLEIKEKKQDDLTKEFPFERNVSVGEFEIKPRYDRSAYCDGAIPGESTPTNFLADQSKREWNIIGKGKSPDSDSEISCKCKNGEGKESLNWDQVPEWLQQKQEKAFPLCHCGRERYDVATETECRICRDYRDCPRCGKLTVFKAERIAKGATCCENCGEWYEGREQWINQYLGEEGLQKIRESAQTLLNSPAFCEVENRQRQIFYPLSDGIYTSGFDKEALEKLVSLPEFGNKLVKLFFSVICGHHADGFTSSDYPEEKVRRVKERLDKETNILAKFVRASDEVIVAVEELREDVGKCFNWSKLQIASPHPFSGSDIEQIEAQWSEAKSGDPRPQYIEILQSLKKRIVDEVEEYRRNLEATRQTQASAGEIWLNVKIEVSSESRTTTNVWAINPDGTVLDPQEVEEEGRKGRTSAYIYGDLSTNVLVLKHSHDNYGYRYTERWEVCYLPKSLTPEQKAKDQELEDEIRYYFAGPGTGFNWKKVGTVVFATEYSRDLQGEEREAYDRMCSATPIDVTLWETSYSEGDESQPPFITVWAREKSFSEEHRELRRQLREAEARLSYQESELQNCYGHGEREYYSRVAVKFQKDPERDSMFGFADVHDFSVQSLRDNEYKTLSGRVRFVCSKQCGNWLETPPQAGETWACSWGKMIGYDKKYNPIIIANPQLRIDEAGAIKAEMENIKAEIAAITSNNTSFEDSQVGDNSGQEITIEDLKRRFNNR